MSSEDNARLFGLGRGWMLTPEQQDAILFDMEWDGVEYTAEGASVSYKLTKEWFAKTISSALEEAVLNHEASQLQPLVVLQGE